MLSSTDSKVCILLRCSMFVNCMCTGLMGPV